MSLNFFACVSVCLVSLSVSVSVSVCLSLSVSVCSCACVWWQARQFCLFLYVHTCASSSALCPSVLFPSLLNPLPLSLSPAWQIQLANSPPSRLPSTTSQSPSKLDKGRGLSPLDYPPHSQSLADLVWMATPLVWCRHQSRSAPVGFLSGPRQPRNVTPPTFSSPSIPPIPLYPPLPPPPPRLFPDVSQPFNREIPTTEGGQSHVAQARKLAPRRGIQNPTETRGRG